MYFNGHRKFQLGILILYYHKEYLRLFHIIERICVGESCRLRKANRVTQSTVFLANVLSARWICLSMKLLLHNSLGNIALKNLQFSSSTSTSRSENFFMFSKSRKFRIVVTNTCFIKKCKILTLC